MTVNAVAEAAEASAVRPKAHASDVHACSPPEMPSADTMPRAAALRDAAPDDISRIRPGRDVQQENGDDEKVEAG